MRDGAATVALGGPGVGSIVSKPTRRAAACGVVERRVFRAASALVAAHVVTDAFVVPEPSTTALDHVVPGLVPLATVALVAWWYPRLRPGARASIALAIGVLALVGAGVEIANATAIGATGDDWTGFLLVPAGLLLWALGAGTLWTSRKPTGRRYLRRTLIGVVGVVAAFELLLPVGVALVATHAPRSVVEPVALGRPHQDVVLSTRDGLRLRGWYVPSENGAAVIAFPGRTSTVPHAKVLARHGYGVLLVDARGRGESDGDPNAFGWGGRPDVDAAVAYLQARPDVEPLRIGGLGLSVGGELLLEAASGNDGLRAVVSDGAGERSVRESILRGPSGWLVLPRDLVLTAAVAVLSGEAPPPSLADVVAEVSPRPLLLVHAGRGGGGEELNPKYFDAAGDPKQIWLIPEAGHTGGLDARPSEYERRMVAFLDRALPPG